MTVDHRQPDDWEPCPSGELTRMVGGIQGRRRRKIFFQVCNGATVGLLLLAVGLAYLRPFDSPADFHDDPRFKAISCQEVQSLVGPMGQGEVDAATVQHVQDHLKVCPVCRDFADQMARAEHVGCEDPFCSHCHQGRLLTRLDSPRHSPRRDLNSR
ncbi:MAG: hypothetical protein N2C14_29580 [Planctomycetales bacterium]